MTLDGSRLYGAELHELTDVILSNKASVAIDALSGQPNVQLPENTELSAGDLALTLGTVEGSGLLRFSDKGQLTVQKFIAEPTVEFKRNDMNFREHVGKTFVQTGQGTAKVILYPLDKQLTEEPAGHYIYEQAYSVYDSAKNTDQTTGAADPFFAVMDILPEDEQDLTQEPTKPNDYDKDVRDEVNHGTWQFDRWELQKHGKEYEYISYWSFVPDQPTPNPDPNPQPEIKQGWKDEEGARYYYIDGVRQLSRWIEDLYYVDDSGKMLTATFTPDGYRVGADGKWVKGRWIKDQTGWWYRYEDGFFHKGEWKKIDKKWYHFDKQGYISTSKWIGDYYLGADGAMLESTFIPDGYYVDADGEWDRTIPRKK